MYCDELAYPEYSDCCSKKSGSASEYDYNSYSSYTGSNYGADNSVISSGSYTSDQSKSSDLSIRSSNIDINQYDRYDDENFFGFCHKLVVPIPILIPKFWKIDPHQNLKIWDWDLDHWVKLLHFRNELICFIIFVIILIVISKLIFESKITEKNFLTSKWYNFQRQFS